MNILNLLELNAQHPIMGITTKEQSAKVALKVLKIKKAYKKFIEEYTEDEKEIITEAGLSLEQDFDQEGKTKEGTDPAKIQRYVELKKELLSKDLKADYEKLTFDEFRELDKENNFATNVDLLTEGILWEEPKEEKAQEVA